MSAMQARDMLHLGPALAAAARPHDKGNRRTAQSVPKKKLQPLVGNMPHAQLLGTLICWCLLQFPD